MRSGSDKVACGAVCIGLSVCAFSGHKIGSQRLLFGRQILDDEERRAGSPRGVAAEEVAPAERVADEDLVVVIVAGAVAYLARKFFGAAPRQKAPPSFVPLSQLKRRR